MTKIPKQFNEESKVLTDSSWTIGYLRAKGEICILTSQHRKKFTKRGHLLNISAKTIKLLKKNMGENCANIGSGKKILAITQNTPYTKEQIDKYDFIKIIKTMCFRRHY